VGTAELADQAGAVGAWGRCLFNLVKDVGCLAIAGDGTGSLKVVADKRPPQIQSNETQMLPVRL